MLEILTKYDKYASETHWIYIITLLTILAFTVSCIAFFLNIATSIANIFLIPIIVAAFIYHKKSLPYIISVTVSFILITLAIAGDTSAAVDVGVYAIIMIGIGTIIALLSHDTHRNEERYKLIFETSPSPLIITDANYNILDLNENFEKLFGYRNEIIGKVIYELDCIPSNCQIEAHNFLIAKTKEPKVESEHNSSSSACTNAPNSVTINIRDAEGNTHTCRIYLSTLYGESGAIEMRMIGFADITQNVIAEEKIKLSLKEKDILLREIHHRVKNNLQIIVSLLKLQLYRTKDPETREALIDCRSRVYSMAMVHEKMYLSKGLASIDLREYLNSLSGYIMMEYAGSVGDVKIEVTKGEPITFDLDSIVPCALITNELITNSLKYAFPNKRDGIIKIDISKCGEESESPYTYTYSDNGIGIHTGAENQENADTKTSRSLGMKIINVLVKQMNGTIDISNNADGKGTNIVIKFKGRI